MARSSILNVRPVLAEFQILVLACILIHQFASREQQGFVARQMWYHDNFLHAYAEQA